MNLLVNEIFESVQGEGPYAGVWATFVRLSGCNLGCEFCDTDYSVSIAQTIDEIAQQVYKLDNKLVVITGGEPTLQKGLNDLTAHLTHWGYTCQIETNGTSEWTPTNMVDVVISPKLHAIQVGWNETCNYYIKYVVFADESKNITTPMIGTLRPKHILKEYFMPCTYKRAATGIDHVQQNKAAVQNAMEAAKQNNGVFCARLHKLYNWR